MAYQIVLSNIGDGKGWSHPIHLHGNHIYVIKMGFGKYDRQSAKFIEETNDIRCTGLPTPNLCNKELWKPESWIRNPNSIPDIKLLHPPIKDTIIVPSGGYVIIRFKASNPGPWFLHSQVNLHTTYGMGMVLYVGNIADSPKPINPLLCWKNNLEISVNQKTECELLNKPTKILLGVIVLILLVVILLAIVVYCRNRKSTKSSQDVG